MSPNTRIGEMCALTGCPSYCLLAHLERRHYDVLPRVETLSPRWVPGLRRHYGCRIVANQIADVLPTDLNYVFQT